MLFFISTAFHVKFSDSVYSRLIFPNRKRFFLVMFVQFLCEHNRESAHLRPSVVLSDVSVFVSRP